MPRFLGVLACFGPMSDWDFQFLSSVGGRKHRSVPWQGRTIGHRHMFFCNEHDITPFNSKTLFPFYHQNSCSVTPITHSVHLACSSLEHSNSRQSMTKFSERKSKKLAMRIWECMKNEDTTSLHHQRWYHGFVWKYGTPNFDALSSLVLFELLFGWKYNSIYTYIIYT